MSAAPAGDETADIDYQQATVVVTNSLKRLTGCPASELNRDEQAQAKKRFILAVAARVGERHLERLTLDRVIIETGGRPTTWKGSNTGLVREQRDKTRQLADALSSLQGCWVYRADDDMYVRLPSYADRIEALTGGR